MHRNWNLLLFHFYLWNRFLSVKTLILPIRWDLTLWIVITKIDFHIFGLFHHTFFSLLTYNIDERAIFFFVLRTSYFSFNPMMRLWFLHSGTVPHFVVTETMFMSFLNFLASMRTSIPKLSHLIRIAWIIIAATLILDKNWVMAFRFLVQAFLQRRLFLELVCFQRNFLPVLNFVQFNYPIVTPAPFIFLGQSIIIIFLLHKRNIPFIVVILIDVALIHIFIPIDRLLIGGHIGYLISHSKSLWSLVCFLFLWRDFL